MAAGRTDSPRGSGDRKGEVALSGYDELPGRIPPQNVEAEQCVLGSMLHHKDAIGEAVLVLDVGDFYVPAHAEVFLSLKELYNRGDAVDLVLATNDLGERGKLEFVGGVDFLVNLMETVPSPAHVTAYSILVRQSSERRALVQAAHEIIRDAYDGGANNGRELLDQAEQKIFAIAQGRERGGSMMDMPNLIKAALLRIDAMQATDSDSVTRGLATHYGELDRKLNGLAPGALYVIAGRPSMGKTSFALNVIDNLTTRDDTAVLLFTLEVTKEQIAENMLCSHARVDAHRLMRGELSDEEYLKVPEAAGRLSQSKLFVDDTPGLTLTRLRAKARRMKTQHDIGLIVVDYLQLLSFDGMVESRQIEISRLSSALKQMSRELSIPVITLSQLNRAVESRQDKRPLMGDLRESGSIEQDADAVLLLYRDEYYYPDKLESKGKAEVIVAKNRNGPTGSVDLFFFPNMMRFENPTFIPESGAPASATVTF